MKRRRSNRLLALGLCLLMLASVFPLSGIPALAAEQGCNHVHDTAVCGYIAEVEGAPCTFQHTPHDEPCGYAEAVEAAPCSVEAAHTVHDAACGGDPDTGEGCTFAHTPHDDACGWAEAKEAVSCAAEATHIHDTTVCGYIEAVAGHPCGHTCDESCGGLTLGDSGPDFVPQNMDSGVRAIPAMNPEAVGIAGKEWWVIGKDGTGVNPQNGTMTLLSKENLIADGAFGSDSQYGSSALKGRMEAFYNGSASPFLAQERALILPRTLDGVRLSDGTDGTLPGNHYVWPLSKDETNSLSVTIRANGSNWWLRSAYTLYDNFADAVHDNGTVTWGTVDGTLGGRPALTLDLNSVLFTSDAAGGKPAVGGELQPYTEPTTGTVKLTVKDDVNLRLNVMMGPLTIPEGGTVSFSYMDAATGAGRSVSVMIQDKDTGGILYYSRPVDCSGAASDKGLVHLKLPDGLTAGTYTLLIFNEQVNGANETDFASTPHKYDLKVEAKTTPGGPGVANGDTVHFAGNEWYVIGLNGAGVNPKDKTMTLLSKENLFTTKFHDSSSEYGGSTLHEKMKEYYTGLSAENRALIQPRTLDGVRVGNDNNVTLPGDHFVWPLSLDEANSLSTTIRANGSEWWLRSPYNNDIVGAVDDFGNIFSLITNVNATLGGRPALTLDLNSAIFASASAGEGGGISPSGKVVVPKTGSQTFTIKANAGYQVEKVLLDGSPVSLTGDSYTLTGAAANCTIEARFVPESAPITPTGVKLNGKVGYAGEEWHVIGLNEENDQVNPRKGAMTLLSVENLIADGAFGSDSQYGSSDLKGRMEAFYNGNTLLPKEKDLILPRELDGVRVGNDYNATLPGDHHVWPLSKAEADSLPQNTIRANGSWWWLRSPSYNYNVGAVDVLGDLDSFIPYVDGALGGRPAMTLNLKSVLFTSDASGVDKSRAALGNRNTVALSTTGTAKLTVVDDANLSLDVTTTGPITAKEGGVASFAYENAKTGTGRSVSVLIQDKTTGDILYYSRPGNCETSGDGTASFRLPNGLTEGTYTLLIFNEQVNSKNVTDFASTPKSMDLKVERRTGNARQVVVGGTDVSGGGYWKNDGSGGIAACGQAEIGAGAWNVRYEAATATLTLKDADIKKGYSTMGASGMTIISGIYADGGLTLCLEGNSAVGGPALDNPGGDSSHGVYVDGNLTVTGTGALVSKAGTADSVSMGVAIDYGGLTMQGGTLTGTGGEATDLSYGVYVSHATVMAGSTLTGTGGKATGANGNSVGLSFPGSSSLAGGKMTGIGGAATGANGRSIGVFNWATNGFYIKGGEVIAQSTSGGPTAQAFFSTPAIDPAYTAARLWYGADEAAALAQGPKAPGDAGADWWKQAYARIADPNPGPGPNPDPHPNPDPNPSPDPGPSDPAYTRKTLTDPSGVRVTGSFTGDAKLEVKERLLHLQGDCDVCDDIRERQDRGELIVLFDISLKSGSYRGDLIVEIPVDEKYNGQTILLIHCKEKVTDSRTVTVSGGYAKGTFTSLSPFAAAEQPGKTVITGLPESYTLLVGQSVRWTPAPAGGKWSYDKNLLEMTRSGGTYTFKALKEGKATATYTVDGVPHTVTITVNSSTIPQTGDRSTPWPWALLATAALLGCAALVLKKGGYKKRHG